MKESNQFNNHKENEETAGIAGTSAGVVAGAQLGSVLVPIPVIGTFTGALVGGILGSKIGKKVGASVMDKFGSNSDFATKPDLAHELERLSKLHSQGLISEAEFAAAKAKLLGL